MRAVVFAGPSVDDTTVRAAGDALEFRPAPDGPWVVLPETALLPPVRRGDIDALYRDGAGPTHIGIVDGQFFQSLSISPKEILRAMDDHQAHVFGSSSMGALRAAELAEWGMVGVGRVFDLYRSGEVDADDEVAITYDADSLRPLCEPMVNIRVALAAAVEREAVTPDAAELALKVAKDLYFPDRTYQRLLHELAGTVGEEERDRLRAFLDTEAPNAKLQDALALLEKLREALAAGPTGGRGPAPR